MTTIYIDSCAWNLLHNFNISLIKELPVDEFDVLMTKEVAEFEIPCIPKEKVDLIEYIRLQTEERGIEIHSYFGFVSYDDPPEYRPRVGGFDEGRFISYEEAAFVEKFKVLSERERKTGLYNNEADASLAVRACTGGIVLTAEDKSKSGPLKKAAELGGKIVNLNNFDPKKLSLRDFISQTVFM